MPLELGMGRTQDAGCGAPQSAEAVSGTVCTNTNCEIKESENRSMSLNKPQSQGYAIALLVMAPTCIVLFSALVADATFADSVADQFARGQAIARQGKMGCRLSDSGALGPIKPKSQARPC